MKKVISTYNAPAAVGAYSQGLVVGDMVYCSGQIPINVETMEMPQTIGGQAEQCLKNLQAVLEEAGSGLDKAVKINIYLTDINDFDIVDNIYSGFFSEKYPCRSTVQVSKIPKGAKIEIDAIAHL